MKQLLLFACLTILLSAQTIIKEIHFNNLTQFSKKTALEITELEIGSQLDIRKIDKAIKKLFSYEYFNDITVSDNNGILTFDFVQKPLIGAIKLKNYKENADQEEVETLLNIKKGEVLDDLKLQNTKNRLIQILKLEGKMDSQVEYEIEDINEDSKKVIFIVNPGEKITIKELRFFGIKHISGSRLEDELDNREKDVWGWLWGRNDGKAKLFSLPGENPKLKRYYLSKGFLDVAITKPLLRVDFTNYDAKLDYYISEGEPYIVERVVVNSDKDIVSKSVLDDEILLENGDTFNIKKLDKMNEKIKLLYKNKGYAYTRLSYGLDKDIKTHKVIININVISGEQVYINDVIISGNSKTLDRVVRRSIYLASKDLYSYTDLTDSKLELLRSGFFKKVEIKEVRIADDLMDLVVELEEDRTGSITIGGGYGDSDGWLFNSSVSDRNVFGYGLGLSLSLDRSKYTEKYTVALTEPRINDSLYSGSVSVTKQISKSSTLVDNVRETSNKDIFSIGLGRRLARRWHANLRYSYSDIDTTYINSLSYIKSSITPSLTYNSTNNFHNPSAGIYATTSVERAGLGGDLKFVKNRNKFTWYFGFLDYIDYDVIFRYKAKYYHSWTLGNLASAEKFKMGGVGTIRGYKSRTLYPINQNNVNEYGGKYMLINNIELSFLLIKDARMRLTFFYDHGMIGEDKLNEIKRAGKGVVLEWISPIGPLDFIFSEAINPSDSDRTSKFEFTLGQRF